MAMGNFPYETDYMTNGGGVLPAFPVRAACQLLAAAPVRLAQAGTGATHVCHTPGTAQVQRRSRTGTA